ncbi:MAG TPA: hypothetical protein VKT32_11240 [Chthonomonadaceae bacterium]|nr:hypothetical protein [Chthonomonadaceae bacterium]
MAARVDLKDRASPVIIGIAVIVVLVFIGWLAYANLFAPPKPPPITPEAQQRMDQYDALAKKAHGDVNNLSPEERDKLMQETGGHGAQILQAIAKQKGY